MVTPEESNQIVQLRGAGLRRDGLSIPGLIVSITKPLHPYYKRTGLHSLARLGAIEAMPAIDGIINTGDPDTVNYAKASKARLLAEGDASGLSGAKATQAKISRFCLELGKTPEEINAGVAAHYDQGGESVGPQPVEVYALREVADILYCDAENSRTAAVPAAVGALNLQRDFPSALKVKIASLPAAARIPTLIQDLSQKKMLNMNDYFEMQLAVDGGQSASSAAAAQLVKMEKDKTQYTRPGSIALLQVIYGVGDKTQVPLVVRLMAAANVEFMYVDLKNGVPHQIVPGY